MNIPKMMREARKAVAQENFEKAELLYGKVLKDREMGGLLDIKTRYAFCVEKVGKISEAIDLYQDIVDLYVDSGEPGAAKALELKVEILCGIRDAELSPANFSVVLDDEVAPVHRDDIVDDITPLDEMDFLSLGTQELALFNEEATQELEVTREMLIIEESLKPDEPVCVDVVLTELGSKPKLNKKFEQTADMTEEVSALQRNEKAKKRDESLRKLKGLIRHGIRRNKADKSVGEQDVEFTDIGDYDLALSEKSMATTGSCRGLFDEEISKTAENLFGDTSPNFKKDNY